MCKINESPCQLHLEARWFIFFFLQREWNGFYSMDWFTVFQSVLKNRPILQLQLHQNQKLNIWGKPLRRRLHMCETVCGVLSAGILAAQALAFSLHYLIRELHRHLLQARSSSQWNQHLSVRPLYRQNSINRSLNMSAASISSLILNSHPVHPLVR